MLQVVLTYVLIAGFFAFERFFRQGAAARSVKTTKADRGSTRLVGLALIVALVLPPLLNLLGVGRTQLTQLRWLGIVLMLIGIVVRAWSMQVLGAYYSRTLRLSEAQSVVTNGPYRLVRHPGYLGTILLWVGSALALGNEAAAVVLVLLMLTVYVHRMRSEEAMLLATLGDRYQGYSKHTWRLLPFVF
jgi:protein-S-isoprenylcysteine O-methyltransferase Ste14